MEDALTVGPHYCEAEERQNESSQDSTEWINAPSDLHDGPDDEGRLGDPIADLADSSF